ncbi:MAG: hypothetical protein ACTSU5_19570 [Promethearchaeota archaeon]
MEREGEEFCDSLQDAKRLNLCGLKVRHSKDQHDSHEGDGNTPKYHLSGRPPDDYLEYDPESKMVACNVKGFEPRPSYELPVEGVHFEEGGAPSIELKLERVRNGDEGYFAAVLRDLSDKGLVALLFDERAGVR